MCLVDPATGNQSTEDRPCLAGGQDYAKYLEAVYDRLTPTFQKMFCSLKSIYIENQLGATAYAGVGKSGVYIGIRRALLDQPFSFSLWATWKEELAFGGKQDSYQQIPGLPYFVSEETPGVSNFLYQVIVHEFGHQFDFANHLNKTVDGCPAPTDADPEPECAFAPGSWGSLSWVTTKKPLPENDFKLRNDFCYYSCGTRVDPLSDATEMYQDLYASAFINGYSSEQAYDDWADGLAYYAMDKFLSKSIAVDTAQGERFDLTMKLHSDRYKKKFDYIESFLARTDIVYP
jgi:hypothetical protein